VGRKAWIMLMEGAYIGSISGEVLISDGGLGSEGMFEQGRRRY